MPKRIEVRRGLGLNEKIVCIGFVGRSRLRRLPNSSSMRSDASLPAFRTWTWLCDGPLAPELYQLAQRLGPNGRISWLDNTHGSESMSAFDIFVMPSLYEAFPYVLVEAAAAGLPIVATPVGGTSAMIQNRPTAFSLVTLSTWCKR